MKPAPPVTRHRVPAIRFILSSEESLLSVSFIPEFGLLSCCHNRARALTNSQRVSNFDCLTRFSQRCLCSFEQAHHAISGVAVANREPLLFDGINEFTRHDVQSF